MTGKKSLGIYLEIILVRMVFELALFIYKDCKRNLLAVKIIVHLGWEES